MADLKESIARAFAESAKEKVFQAIMEDLADDVLEVGDVLRLTFVKCLNFNVEVLSKKDFKVKG
jgi:hypothetical protein